MKPETRIILGHFLILIIEQSDKSGMRQSKHTMRDVKKE